MPAQPLKTYWVDRSCDEAAGGNFEAYITEARHWAKRAHERLRSPSDTDFARVFNVIFKAPKTDTVPCSKPSFWQQVNGIQPEDEWKPSAHHVLDALHDFAHNWTRTPYRETADVRLYSNTGLTRWQPTPTGTLYDPINHIHLTGSWPGLIAGQAFTSWLLPDPPIPGNFENPHRVTIDICPPAWESTTRSLTHPTTGILPHNPNQTQTIQIQTLSPRSSPASLLHKFMHSRVYLLDDHPSDGETSGWEYCMRRKKGAAAGCAESVAMLGLQARLADLGFTVGREWDGIGGGWEDLDEEGFSDSDSDGEEIEEGEVKEEVRRWDVGVEGNGAVRGEAVFFMGWGPGVLRGED